MGARIQFVAQGRHKKTCVGSESDGMVLRLHDASHMPLRQNFALLCCASSNDLQRPINWDACAPLLVHVFVNISVVEAIRPLLRSLVARIPFVLHKGFLNFNL